MNNEETKAKISKAYNDLNVNTLDQLENFYAETVEFHDPIGSINGLKNLKDYYREMYKNVKSISFEFHDFIIQDQNVVAFWTMTYSANILNGGAPIKVPGTSHLKFDDLGKVVFHRDYFDVGTMVYEHVPVVGFVIRKIKDSLEKK